MAAGRGSGPLEKLSLTAAKGYRHIDLPKGLSVGATLARETYHIFRQTVVVRATSASPWIRDLPQPVGCDPNKPECPARDSQRQPPLLSRQKNN